MTPEERKIDDLIDTLVVAQKTAVLTAQEANPFASNVELVPIANELLDRLKAEAKASLLQMLDEARIDELESFCGYSNEIPEHVLKDRIAELRVQLKSKEKES